MSRIGYKVIQIPAGVEVTATDNYVVVKGPHGTLEKQFSDLITINQEEQQIALKRANESEFAKKIHGTTRALLANMIVGVTEKFSRRLEITGVGYRALLEGKKLVLALGYSHPVEFEIPENITVTLPKNTSIIIEGIDKQVVGEFAAKIRATRKPEPYKGKGIRYSDEVIRRKEGKVVS